MKVNQAIPVIMGSNIGTSITSTLVSFGHVVGLFLNSQTIRIIFLFK